MRQFVSFILLIVFSATNIPVQATGKLLASNQLQEEVVEDACAAGESSKCEYQSAGNPFEIKNHPSLAACPSLYWANAYFGERIPPNHTHEKLVPPPNRGVQ